MAIYKEKNKKKYSKDGRVGTLELTTMILMEIENKRLLKCF